MKTVLLLRHADIDQPAGPAPQNWPLNSAGQARAATLVHVVGDAGVGTIYVSEALRTQQTAGPVAAKLALQVKQVPNTVPQFVQQILSGQDGSVVLVVGHSNTVPEMITALGAAYPGPPILQGHDDLFIVTLAAAGQATATRLKYGQRTP